MGIFTSIKEGIFGHEEKRERVARPEPAVSVSTAPQPRPQPAETRVERELSPSEAAAEVNVENSLDSMPGADRLNWRTSIVDLMKLIGVDSSLDARKALARELGYTGELDGSAEMNVWLHRRTMQELARHGGVVPAEFLD